MRRVWWQCQPCGRLRIQRDTSIYRFKPRRVEPYDFHKSILLIASLTSENCSAYLSLIPLRARHNNVNNSGEPPTTVLLYRCNLRQSSRRGEADCGGGNIGTIQKTGDRTIKQAQRVDCRGAAPGRQSCSVRRQVLTTTVYLIVHLRVLTRWELLRSMILFRDLKHFVLWLLRQSSRHVDIIV